MSLRIKYDGLPVTVAKKPLWKYDYGQTLTIEEIGLADGTYETHFAAEFDTNAIVTTANVSGGTLTAPIPDQILAKTSQWNYKAYAHVYVPEANAGTTIYTVQMAVAYRASASGEEPTPAEQSAWQEAMASLAAYQNAINATVARAAANLAGIYSASGTYEVGDYCIYVGKLYRCTTAIATAEAWDSGHWAEASLADVVASLESQFEDFQVSIDASMLDDGSLPRSKVDTAFESTLAKADSAMQPSVYDPNGFGSRAGVDPYSYALARAGEVQAALNALIAEIRDAYAVYSSESDRSDYPKLGDAVRGAYIKARQYANALLADYEPFGVKIVSVLPAAGSADARTFYLVPKDSGAGYDKYWVIVNQSGSKVWDSFGASSTVVVEQLPQIGEPDADYILHTAAGYLYYKYINNRWEVIAGSIASVLDELPQTGNDLTDYYIYDDEAEVYIHYRWIDGAFEPIGADGYTKNQIDSMLASLSAGISRNASDILANTQRITSLGQTVESIAQQVAAIDVDPVRYYATITTEDNENYTYTLYETEDGTDSIVSQFLLPATGGGGGGQSTTTLVVDRITPSPVICTPTDSVIIEIDFSSTDSDGEVVDGIYTIKKGSTTVQAGSLVQGRNSFDLTDECGVGTQKFTLTVTDEGGSVNVKTWTVQVVDVRLESSFSDRYTYPIGQAVNFTYTPYGAVSKTVHVKLDGVELPSVTTSASGTLQSYSLPAQTHGAHLLECWITAMVSSTPIETAHIFRDIIWYDETSNVPVIGCTYRYDNYGEVEARQYSTTAINYVVYAPGVTNPEVTLEEDGVVISTLRLTQAANVWAYKTAEIGEHELVIRCGAAYVTIMMDIEELGYDIEPITANLQFDFNPVGRSNSAENRIWEDDNNPNVQMTVSQNFNWDTGGYQLDDEGNQFFLVKAGTRAWISYNLFGTDPKQAGSEFKVIFQTENVRDPDATFLSCLTAGSEAQVGLQMDAHQANIYTSSDTLVQPYSEEDTIEYEFCINPLDLEDQDATSYIMAYEDGVAARALIYNAAHRIYQYTPGAIEIGSDDCDVRIYRMKAYSSALSDSDILKNFVADSLDSDKMIARYERNQIFDENGEVTPESVANACPDLKVIMIDCPHFTNDKSDYVKNTNVRCIHRNGDTALDNWVWQNGYHAGQGTTSNRYGLAGRNIDVIFGADGQHQITKKIPLDPSYISVLTLGDGTTYSDGHGKIGLKRTSVPNDWFNIKVNIASSENANNALLQKRYNDFLPYISPARRRDPRVKNSMEFVNCIIFVRENDPDLATHREFTDTGWHFYAIGNIGDSKKTDNTRVNDRQDLKEFVVEISDNTLPNATFDTGVYEDTQGNVSFVYSDGCSIVYPITTAQWEDSANTKHTSLYNDWDGSFEFRYDMGTKDGETIPSEDIEAQQELSKQVFRDMYEWVITSSDADFVAHLGDWFIAESPLYWYLFTERYTMIDNRAKNSFWHYGKVYISEEEAEEMGDDAENYTIDDAAASINDGYRFELWNYDDDTALGIDNNGELTMTYGYEDIDLKPDGGPVYNGAESVFWRRIRGLMHNQLRTLYQTLESQNAWTAASLISEFDAWQEQFPEQIWRLDIERKYLRPYFTGNPVAQIEPTQDFLKNMMNGRKRYQRRQFERNQEIYIGTKYRGSNQCADSRAISFRCNTPTGAVVPPDYTIRVVPYSDMYLSVAYGNATPQQVRAKAGQEYTFTTDMTTMDDTQILVYCAENIMALNDLSACYIRANNFAYAKRLKTLVIGSGTEGYSNPFITALNIGNNALLEELDIRNCPNLAGSINLSACGNLETLLAEGTAIASVTFAANGAIETAHIPGTVTSLSFRNIKHLTDLDIDGFDNLETLVCEYSDIDALSILGDADGLQVVRLLGIDWTLAESAVLNRCLAMNSSLLTGEVYIDGAIRQNELDSYAAAWPDLEVTYDPTKLVTQYQVTYANADGTILYQTYVDRGSSAPDPVSAGLIDTPTLESTDQYDYTYTGWDDIDSPVLASRTVTAQYSQTTRTYTVRWFSDIGVLLETQTVEARSEANYNGSTPTKTTEESTYIVNLFSGWDKSTGCVTQDLDVYAVWERAALPPLGTELEDMSCAEVFAVATFGKAEDYFTDKDHIDITLGTDFNFSNVESRTILENRFFDGVDDVVDTNIKLFDEDAPDFTIAIDFEILTGNPNGATLAACYDEDGSEGFRLRYNSNYGNILWGDKNQNVGYVGNRNMVVLRHRKGSSSLYVYAFNLGNSEYSNTLTAVQLVRTRNTETDQVLSFGAVRYQEDGSHDYYAKGWIHWCKIWYADLGIENAKQLASSPRIVMRREFIGANRFRLAGAGSARANVTLMDATPLPLLHVMNPTNTNAGGWDQSSMRSFLNTRVLDMYPTNWRSAMKQVKVSASAGNQSSELVVSSDTMFLAATREVGGDTTEPYASEGTAISFYTTNQSRVKFPGMTIPEDARFFSGNTDPTALDGTNVKEGDIWIKTDTDSIGFYYIPAEIKAKHSRFGYKLITDSANIAASNGGLWLRAYYWWLRSPYVASSTNFRDVITYGYPNYGSASYTYGVVSCSAI